MLAPTINSAILAGLVLPTIPLDETVKDDQGYIVKVTYEESLLDSWRDMVAEAILKVTGLEEGRETSAAHRLNRSYLPAAWAPNTLTAISSYTHYMISIPIKDL